MKKVFLITLAVFALFAFFSFSAKANVTTGDSNAYQCVDNQINTSVDFQNWYRGHCQTPTPTPTCTPEVTPTPEVSITPTPTIDSCANGGCQTPPGGPGDGRSDGQSDGRSDGRSSSPTQAVLGLSTTSSDQNGALQIAGLLVAFVLSAAGFALYKKNA